MMSNFCSIFAFDGVRIVVVSMPPFSLLISVFISVDGDHELRVVVDVVVDAHTHFDDV